MTTLQEQIVTALAGVSGGRIFPHVAPINTTKPYVTYFIVSKVPETMLDSTTPISNYRIQFDVYDTTYSGSDSTATLLKTALITTFKAVLLQSGELYEQLTFEYRNRLDFSFWSV